MDGVDKMKHCWECGHQLIKRYLKAEGDIPYCEVCQSYRFPIFNTAVSMIVVNPKQDKILMIQQYGKGSNVLVAGYVNKGEYLEEAMIREVREEIGRDVVMYQYLNSEYYAKSNTVIANFYCVIDSENLENINTCEIDEAQWFTFEEAKRKVKPESLAQRFLMHFFTQYSLGKVTEENERIT